MIGHFLLLIPGVGPFLAAGWNLLSTPTGRRIIFFAVGIATSFMFGWSLKARLDRSATLQAVIAKQQIDLRAAKDAAEQAAVTAAFLSDTDTKNQEIIRDLETRLAQRPPIQQHAATQRPQGGPCALDDATARSLRRLR